jgi:hypothetical protein
MKYAQIVFRCDKKLKERAQKKINGITIKSLSQLCVVALDNYIGVEKDG